MPFKYSRTYAPRANRSRNATLAKKNAIQLLTIIGSIFILIIKIIAGVLWLIKLALTVITRIVVRIFGLPAYRYAKSAALKSSKYHSYVKQQFGENFSRNMVIYGGLILISIFTATTNIKARELRPEEVGKNSGLYKLISARGDFDLIIEEGININEDGAAPQLAETQNRALSEVGVESQIEPIGNLPAEDLSLLTGAGDALIKPDITATDISPQTRDKIITYIVEEGDTVSEVAEKFNLSTNTILWENKIGPRDFIKPGQELVILPVIGVTYTVKRGDTLNAIAAAYRAKAEDILEVNKLADASELKVGSKIVVPDGIPPPSVVPVIPRSGGFADLSNIFKPAKPIAGKLNWPTTSRRITQYFRGWSHTGLDIGTPKGSPVYAADDGVVVTSGWNTGGYGYYIIIDHGNGIKTLYAHNTKNGVKKGDRVKKGEVIAVSGSTGRSTGPHVHFEVRVGGNIVNPLDYL